MMQGNLKKTVKWITGGESSAVIRAWEKNGKNTRWGKEKKKLAKQRLGNHRTSKVPRKRNASTGA